MTLADGSELDLKRHLSQQGTSQQSVKMPASDWTWSVGFPPEKKLEELARDMKRFPIEKALLQSGNNIIGAARLLGIHPSDALNKQIKTLKISVAKRHTSKGDVSDSHSTS